MNLQENIQRIKSMMGLLNEVTNPYSTTWLEPTKEYFKQELDELLGNDTRFSEDEFFHPQNYDLMYSLFPHTFKMIAEHSKGSDINNEQEIKDILLNKEIPNLMDDWENFREVLLKDKQSQKEGFNLFNKGKMEPWDEEKINSTFNMGNIKTWFSKSYEKNIKAFKKEKNRELPPPFVMRLPSGGEKGNEYILIGGHKRSTAAIQLGIPITVWFIDLTI